MNAAHALALVVALGFGGAASAQEFQPYPTPKITLQQWVSYLALVKSKPQVTVKSFPEKQLIVFTDHTTHTQYSFTAVDHPAHPAWITRQIVDDDGQINVRQIGYFAGSEEQFAALFDSYLKLNAQIRKDVQLRNQ